MLVLGSTLIRTLREKSPGGVMPTLAEQGLRVLSFSGTDRRLLIRATGNEPYMSGQSILGLQRALEVATQEELEVSTTLHRAQADSGFYLRLVFSSTQLFDKDEHQRLSELLVHYNLPELVVAAPSQPSSIPDVLFTTRTGQVMLNPAQTFSLGQLMAWALQLAEATMPVKDITFGLRSEYPCFEADATTPERFTTHAEGLWACRYPYGATLMAQAFLAGPARVTAETVVHVFTNREVSPEMLEAAFRHCRGSVGPQVSTNAEGNFCKGSRGEAFRLRVKTVNDHQVADRVVQFLRYIGIQPIGTLKIDFGRYTEVIHTFRAYDAPPPDQGSALTLPTPQPDAGPESASVAPDPATAEASSENQEARPPTDPTVTPCDTAPGTTHYVRQV